MPATPHTVRAPRGTTLSCANWQIEAAWRMLQNNLDPEVAERPLDLVVYGGSGKAARNWECFEALLESLRRLQPDETLLVQSGKPVGVFKTHLDAPRVLIANSNLVPRFGTWDHFRELERRGLMTSTHERGRVFREPVERRAHHEGAVAREGQRARADERARRFDEPRGFDAEARGERGHRHRAGRGFTRHRDRARRRVAGTQRGQ